ncbi:hypothetical protein ACP3S8_09370 [Mixta calida]|uniref:hypothetical protein n=1 Tax=Mixta calida TaxID=665913 RepID=UPI003CF029E2
MDIQKMTNEERQALIERVSEIYTEYSKPNHSKAFSVKDTEIAKLALIALAALTAEPVAFTAQSNIDGFGGGVGYMWPPGNEKPTDVALYANPIDNTAPQYEALAGWKMVPVEPTEEMLAAGDKFMDGLSELGNAYSAMVEAAPKLEGKHG